MRRRKKPDPAQLSFAFVRPPDIRGETTIGGIDLWYCPKTCCWVSTPT